MLDYYNLFLDSRTGAHTHTHTRLSWPKQIDSFICLNGLQIFRPNLVWVGSSDGNICYGYYHGT